MQSDSNPKTIKIDGTHTLPGATGNILVVEGGYLTLTGTATGSVEVEKGGKARIGARVNIHVINRGGEVWLTPKASVGGKVESDGGLLHVYNGLVGQCSEPAK